MSYLQFLIADFVQVVPNKKVPGRLVPVLGLLALVSGMRLVV
jgi:hypothetical protein